MKHPSLLATASTPLRSVIEVCDHGQASVKGPPAGVCRIERLRLVI
ncbi:hypothetical protein ACF08N_35645 [Streptomyces sp. NPDC015127]